MATATTDIDEIRRRMALIRRELHEDVRGVVSSAEAVTDWRRYIRMYPWAAVGLAVAVGYLVVPRRHRSIPKDVATQSDIAQVREVVQEAKVQEKTKKGGILGATLAFIGPLVWRAAQGYAVSYLENWIVQQQAQQQTAAGPPPAGSPQPPGGAGRPRGMA